MKILDGTKVSNEIKDELKDEVDTLVSKNIRPGLGVILVGENIESVTYVNMKKKACQQVGIKSVVHNLCENILEDEIIQIINDFNENPNIHGILVQLPLPDHINKKKVLNSICNEKDVDGMNTYNSGKIMLNDDIQITPCTPRGCIELLDYYNIPIQSKKITIIGSSNLVGLPLSILLLHRGGTVTICNINTLDVKSHVVDADIVVACCGVPHLVKEDWIKPGSVVIDVGINKINDNSKKGYKLVGDVDYENIKNKVDYITPVPGGVGPMTIAILMKQTVEICRLLNLSKI